MWAVMYENGMSLTTASERTAQTLAHAEQLRGRSATIRRLDDVDTPSRGADKAARRAGGSREPELIRPPARFTRPKLVSEPKPPPAGAQASETSLPEPTRALKPAHAPVPARRRRFALYALAAAVIVLAAALADHWGAMPRLGAHTSSSPTKVSGPPRPPRLVPPLEQPPVTHFGNAASAGRPSTIARGGGN
jgi:hypothetical protein